MKKVIKKETPVTEVSTQIVEQEQGIVNFNAETLISQAISQKLPVDTMERLLAMRKELKAEWSKEQFDSAMANFQAECPTIQKTKKVSFGTTNYSYAPLEVIVEQVKSILSANGFSYTFDTKETEKGLTIYVLVKHTAGHTEKSECSIEIDNNSKMNISQKSGAAISYGKRYAFCNAFGILTGDEDTDANTPNGQVTPPKTYTKYPAKPAEALNAYNSLADQITKAATVDSLNLIATEVKIAFSNKKINQGQLEMLVEIGKSMRDKLGPQAKEAKEIADSLPFGGEITDTGDARNNNQWK